MIGSLKICQKCHSAFAREVTTCADCEGKDTIPKAWWERLRADVDNILEAESKRDPLATLGVLGFVKKCMARIEKGE